MIFIVQYWLETEERQKDVIFFFRFEVRFKNIHIW